MIWTIFKPFNYLAIKADNGSKIVIDIYMPIILSLIITGFLLFLNLRLGVNIYDGTHKVASSIMGLVQTLPGFYIAALAAIIAFPSRALDKDMTNPSMIIQREYKDRLTRRRLLCYLLAYLAFIGIIICLLIILVEFCYSFSLNINPGVIILGYIITSFILFFLLSQLVLLTFTCLWYFGERIHFNDPD